MKRKKEISFSLSSRGHSEKAATDTLEESAHQEDLDFPASKTMRK